MKILIVGGAGYIGSHVVKLLTQSKHEVSVLDNLSTGFEISIKNQKLFKEDLSNKKEIHNILETNEFDAIMHFASSIDVHESFLNPKKYYENNVVNTLNLLEAMIAKKIKYFIFSSSAAIYGDPEKEIINEDHQKNPINPYGKSKLMVEEILSDYEKSYNLKFSCLRYFNVCGAHQDGSIGERHNPETHFIPLVLQTASGRKKKLEVFGNDYKTHDGTCLRDYVHVMDIATAHILALEYLLENNQSNSFNIGNNRPYSIREIIQVAKTITKKDIDYIIKPRREGDPKKLIADNQKIKTVLGWMPQYSDIENIISTAWAWEQILNKESL